MKPLELVTLTTVSIRPDGVVVGAAVGPVAVGPPVVSHADRDGMLQSGMESGAAESMDRLDEYLAKG